MLIDIHVHSTISQDGKCDMEDYVKHAIEKGAEILGFSEHFDMDYIANNVPIKHIEPDKYKAKFDEVKYRYGDQIKLLFGAEFGFDSKASMTYDALNLKYGFDYVINSVHLINGEDCYIPTFFDGKERSKTYNDYLEAILESLSATYNYEIIGHIGYISRYAPFNDKLITRSFNQNLIDEILKKIITLDKCLEINTSTKGLCEFVPTFDIVAKYCKLGGKLISFGSDSHNYDRLFEKLPSVISSLKVLGINELCYYEKREPHFIKI